MEAQRHKAEGQEEVVWPFVTSPGSHTENFHHLLSLGAVTKV